MPIGKQISEKISTNRRISNTRLQEEVDRLLAAAQLKDVGHIKSLFPHELSGGMQQRVMIAIALANEPDLLVADEPTTALDVTTQKEIIDIIKAQQKETGLSILYISHDLALVSRYAGTIGVLYAGVLMGTDLPISSSDRRRIPIPKLCSTAFRDRDWRAKGKGRLEARWRGSIIGFQAADLRRDAINPKAHAASGP